MCAAYRFTSLKKQLKNNATRTNRCQRKTNISFIKTHKTASTAVQVSYLSINFSNSTN